MLAPLHLLVSRKKSRPAKGVSDDDSELREDIDVWYDEGCSNFTIEFGCLGRFVVYFVVYVWDFGVCLECSEFNAQR